MIDLIISKQTIAIIFEVRESRQGQVGLWKIAFGTDQKKVFPKGFYTLDGAVKEASRLGFGGYRAFSKNYRQHTRTRISMKSILQKAVPFKSDPIMFKNEKNWRSVYTRGYANNTEDYSN